MKLKTKLTISISLLVLVIVVTASLLYLNGLLHEQMHDIYSHSDFIAHSVFQQVPGDLRKAAADGQFDPQHPLACLGQSRSLNDLLQSAIAYPATSSVRDVAIVDAQGTIVADSNPDLVGNSMPERPELESLTLANWRSQISSIFGREKVYQVSLPPLLLNGQPVGTIRVGVDTVLVRSALAARMRSIFFVASLIVLFAVVLAVAFSDFVLSPLVVISAQLDRAARGEPVAESPEAWGAEYGAVSSKIQQIGRQLQDARHIYSTLQENVTQVLESLEEGVVMFGAEGRAIMASAAAQGFLEMLPSEIVGRPVEEIFPSNSSLDRAVRLAVRQQVALPGREVERRPGSQLLLMRLDVLRDRERVIGSLLILRDAERVRRLEDEIEVARRLSAIGRLTRGVAHEVKNPLNAMAIHLDLLREKARQRGGQELDNHVEVIRREIDRLDRVVKTFLDFTRPVEVQLRETDLAELAQSVVELVQADAQMHGIRLDLQFEEPHPTVWLDRDLVEQAILNLVGNGLQAMEQHEGGDAPQERTLTVAVTSNADFVSLWVRDQGPGVPQELRDKIFDLYFTTKAEGSGIGLALTARVMQLHNGSVDLISPPGQGSTFILRFPARRQPRPERAQGLALAEGEAPSESATVATQPPLQSAAGSGNGSGEVQL